MEARERDRERQEEDVDTRAGKGVGIVNRIRRPRVHGYATSSTDQDMAGEAAVRSWKDKLMVSTCNLRVPI